MPANPYRLTRAAQADLEGIWDFTAHRWSADQADRYVGGLFEAFETIAGEPGLMRERTEYDPPVRIYPCKAHVVIYRVEDDTVTVIRVRHGREDWRTDPGSGL